MRQRNTSPGNSEIEGLSNFEKLCAVYLWRLPYIINLFCTKVLKVVSL